MKDNFIPLLYSSFGTEDEQAEQITAMFGKSILKKVYLDYHKAWKISEEFKKIFPNAQYDYGMGGFVYSVLSTDKERAIIELKNIIKNNNLDDKYVIKNKKFISKDLLYSEPVLWMCLPENKYEKKLRENDLTM